MSEKRKDFAKVYEAEDGHQILITVTYDGDEDRYLLKVSGTSEKIGGCFLEQKMWFEQEEDAYQGFDKVNSHSDLEGLFR